MSIRLEFEIAFRSDYHVGAGHGLGLQVDSALLRDADGVPVIRGTALAGLLRESLANLLALAPFAGEQRCQAAGNRQASAGYCGQYADNGDMPCPVCRIFGTPRHHKRWRISSARPEGLTAPQAPSDKWRAGETASQITTRVRVNPRTRRAEENKLFTREEGDGVLRFRFVAECEHHDGEAQREAEWLVAAARMLRNLGAGKRRGYGECEIRLVDRDQEAAILDRFAKRLQGEQVEKPARPASDIGIKPLDLSPDPGNRACRMRVLIRLDEPLLVARRAEAGNQYETLETVPGSVLRGALAWRIARRFALSSGNISIYRTFVQLFFRDSLRFSALSPVTVIERTIGYPSIPAPRDMVTCELYPGFSGDSGEGHGIWSLLRDSSLDECPVCSQQKDSQSQNSRQVKLESLNGYISLIEDIPRSKHKPASTVEMHIRIDPNSGRVRTGDLYGYVALEAGQYFVGEITCTNESVWNALRTMADLQSDGAVNELKLGKAAQRGYGRVSAVFQPIDKPLFHVQSLNQRLTSTEHVTMLLLSDAIVPDPWGRFWRGFDPAWLKRELQLPDGAEVSIDCNQNGEALAFSAVRTVDAFNAVLGLPRARDIALVAGSSVRLSFKGIEVSDLVKHLEEVENRGIGLRRDEGFGRVAFNHPVYQQLQGIDSPMLDLSPLELADVDISNPFVAMLEFAREWAQKLDEQSFDCFNDERFEAVARLLHVLQHTSVDAIKRDLAQMGSWKTLPVTSLNGRDKPNFFETDGQQGMDVIKKMLDALANELKARQLEHNPQAWRMGLQMLAARIAAPARQNAQERR